MRIGERIAGLRGMCKHKLKQHTRNELESRQERPGALEGAGKKLPSGVEAWQARENGGDLRWSRKEFERRRRYNAKRPFGPNQEVFKIIPGVVLAKGL